MESRFEFHKKSRVRPSSLTMVTTGDDLYTDRTEGVLMLGAKREVLAPYESKR